MRSCFVQLLHVQQIVRPHMKLFSSSQTACNVVLLLNHAVSVCELQQAGDAALQQAGAPMQARIIGEMERVGEHLFPCICFTLFCL